MLLGERIRNRRGRNEAARDQDLAKALARAFLLGERLDQIVLADQASFYQQCAKPTPTRICRIHTQSTAPQRQRLIREPTQGRLLRPRYSSSEGSMQEMQKVIDNFGGIPPIL